MFAFHFHSLLDGFAVRDLGSRENNGNTEAGFQLGNSNVEVDITLTGNEKLLRFGIVFIFESTVFLKKLIDTLTGGTDAWEWGVGGEASDELWRTVQIRVTALSPPFPPAGSSEEWKLRLGEWVQGGLDRDLSAYWSISTGGGSK